MVALGLVVVQLLQAAFRDRSDRVQRDRIFVLMILMVFNVVFWACFEQAGSSLTLFANLAADLAYSMVDPRIRVGRRRR